ncbi:hypothetical protein C8F01DRAFT_1068165 [Mycena amicta]|nr:hypothetical protein C8F01DRAFT_1068165 [Mycena amicta]
MARTKKAIPGFKESADGRQVCCTICEEDHPSHLERWMARSSAAGHLTSSVHLAHAANLDRKEKLRQDQASQLRNVYSGPDVAPIASSAEGSVRPGMFDVPSPDMELPPFSIFPESPIDTGIPSLDVHDTNAERDRLAEQLMLLLMQAEDLDQFGERAEEEDTTVPFSNTFDDDEDVVIDMEPTLTDSQYQPYPNRMHMLLDIIDNLPRLRLSSSHFNIIIWLLKQCGVQNVPSLSSLRKTQAELTKLCGNEPKPYTSTAGNRFFVNDVRDSVAKDFSNPEIAKHLHFYPEETSGPISEVWQAERWKEYTPSELTPMFSRGHRRFWIDEVAELDSGAKILPVALIVREGELCADYFDVLPHPSGWKLGVERKKIPVSRIMYNFDDVVQRVGDKIHWSAEFTIPAMPNPLREKVDADEDLYVVMIPLWADDVSGNKSKQYNKHINVYMVNSNLPGQLLQQEYFVRFVSTSPNATSPEQFSALKEQIQSVQFLLPLFNAEKFRATETNPIRCFNANTGRKCRAILRVPGLPADNPQQSEEASHMGGNANRKCRRCKVGGGHEITESDQGYHALHFAGFARTAAETKKILLQQLELALLGVKAPIDKLQTATGIKDKVAQYWIDIILEKARKMKAEHPTRKADNIATELRSWLAEQPGDKVNPLLDFSGLDPNRDTPVEILHTILLGIIKYAWHLLHTSWSSSEQDLFAVRLQSTDTDGLTIPPIRAAYMMQYRNGLIGKHFKALMQTMVFHMHEITSPEQFALVKAVCALGPLLWVSEIDNMEQYTHDLNILIGNVLDAFGDTNPARIIQKMKIHLLPHIIEDAVRFGPPIRNSTEVFEGYNAVFRMCSILSNHQAPSRDIALKFASMDRVKHILSGGYWKDGTKWVCAGPAVVDVLKTMPVIQRHLGWVPATKIAAGTVRLPGREKRVLLPWLQTTSSTASALGLAAEITGRWSRALSVTAESGDVCKEKSWICVRDKTASLTSLYFGRVLEILSSEDGKLNVVTFEQFLVSERLHPQFDMPVLHRPDTSGEHHICISATVSFIRVFKPLTSCFQSILFRFSAEHDCRMAGCQPTAVRPVIQERVATSRTISLLEHADNKHFLINMTALHNATLLRRVLPRALTVPRPIYTDRRAHHSELAALLRVSQKSRRAATQAKRRVTLAKKLEQVTQEMTAAGPSSGEQEVRIDDHSDGETTDDGYEDVLAASDNSQSRKKRKRARKSTQ